VTQPILFSSLQYYASGKKTLYRTLFAALGKGSGYPRLSVASVRAGGYAFETSYLSC